MNQKLQYQAVDQAALASTITVLEQHVQDRRSRDEKMMAEQEKWLSLVEKATELGLLHKRIKDLDGAVSKANGKATSLGAERVEADHPRAEWERLKQAEIEQLQHDNIGLREQVTKSSKVTEVKDNLLQSQDDEIKRLQTQKKNDSLESGSAGNADPCGKVEMAEVPAHIEFAIENGPGVKACRAACSLVHRSEPRQVLAIQIPSAGCIGRDCIFEPVTSYSTGKIAGSSETTFSGSLPFEETFAGSFGMNSGTIRSAGSEVGT